VSGLRERQRTAAMYRIQTMALDLFERRGYDDVTIEEIAEASDVSASSIYRYFGTKEQLVLWDEYDPVLGDHIERAVADEVPLAGLRREMTAAIDAFTPEDERRLVRRLRLTSDNPELEKATVGQVYAATTLVEEVLARQLDRPVDDLEVQVFAHALIGGFVGLFHHWQGSGFREPLRELVAQMFEIFEEGLDIVTASEAAREAARDRPREPA
jgi:AcrR family transcriptional regulator